MIPKLIKNEEGYRAALEHVDSLMGAQAGTPELDELELWVHLVQAFEERVYPISLPDPVAAIRFRLEQSALSPADLIPYIGAKSRVSEILNHKRSLSLAMIRRLHAGLGIPLALLIQEPEPELAVEFNDVDWRSFPLREIVKRRWFGEAATTSGELLQQAEELLGGMIRTSEAACPGLTRLRLSQSANEEEISPALRIWKARVWDLASRQAVGSSAPAVVDESLVSQIVRLSLVDRGPLLAQEMLAKLGVRLVFEAQLPGTRLDGAAMRCLDGTAVVGLTLRYDRLDYFWFTLCHELAHLALHVKDPEAPVIADDLEAADRQATESEADALAAEAMIPGADWAEFMKNPHISEEDIVRFAARQRLHPSIVAGRFRKHTGDYSRFSSLLGHRKVRTLFSFDERAAVMGG